MRSEQHLIKLTTKLEAAGTETAMSCHVPFKMNEQCDCDTSDDAYQEHDSYVSELESYEIERYSRQLLTGHHWQVPNQVNIRQARVLIVGAGGIGSTVIPYLAGAGVGTLLVVDSDIIETTNLHRQGILHRDNIGQSKAVSAAQAVQCINPHVTVEAIDDRISPDTISIYLDSSISCVVDCSDNPYTRYTLNDACFFQKIPLVSASAIGSSAQITVFNYTECCYRCLFPYHSAGGASTQNCNDHGVWGPVPGLIGSAAAMECLKVVGGFGQPLYHHSLVYQADTAEAQRWKKPSESRKKCLLCGESRSIHTLQDTKENLKELLSCSNNTNLANDTQVPQVSVEEYQSLRMSNNPHILLDVRNTAQFRLVHLPNSLHVPLEKLLQSSSSSTTTTKSSTSTSDLSLLNVEQPVYVVCRRGIASTMAVRHLQQILPEKSNIYHIQGGLDAWRTKVDPSFPKY